MFDFFSILQKNWTASSLNIVSDGDDDDDEDSDIGRSVIIKS